MCGYFGNLHECPAVLILLLDLGLPIPYPGMNRQNYQKRIVEGHISQGDGEYQYSDPFWWYQMDVSGDKLVPSNLTTFNARNLSGPLYGNAIKTRRGIVIASEIGESIGSGKDKKSYLMKSQDGLLLGTVYKDWQAPNGECLRTMAIITRDPHERFKQYHDKSTPLFLPHDIGFIKEWLNPSILTSLAIEEALTHPKLYNDLEVTQVKTFKRGEPLSAPQTLNKD
ncbi:SOS response-associated peptidase family protein [Teredinibacter sp. KSP-S5-2]|uniref:SOS response-associated peptidase family protein n=1 Tax=Teredinibacter sp. KSP-S5-2 TaxID=3034506 RepID=UPI00293518A5|nr:SOS response-associated peptidase family protein [Teredinibacter sp. KSP-S5-2]WNO10479.1 SOS response-associated peptidase family protein [Teredinibacter sp. KSP-S5-2]